MGRFIESKIIYQGIIWATEAVACVLLAVRLISRLRSQRRLFWDDGFIIFALILTLTTAALWQWAAPTMYWTLQISQGATELTTSLEEFFEKLKLWLRVTFLAAIFFYTSLTAVKISFLLFFRRLGDRVYGFKWYWWPTLFFVLSTWVIGIGTTAKEAECELPKNLEVLFYECQASTFTSFDSATIKVMCVLDILSDFLSMYKSPETRLQRDDLTTALITSYVDPVRIAVEHQDAFAQEVGLLRAVFAIFDYHGYCHRKGGRYNSDDFGREGCRFSVQSKIPLAVDGYRAMCW